MQYSMMFRVEGVLADARDGEFSPQPITEGLLLHQLVGLSPSLRVSYVTALDEVRATHWLRVALSVGKAPRLFGGDEMEAINTARSLGHGVDLYVTADPAEAARTMREGVTTLLFAHPSYARAEFRPDAPKEIRRWDVITEEIERQALLKSEDQRVGRDLESVADARFGA